MLHTVTELSEDILRDIRRQLRDEVDSYALASYQSDHLLDLV